MTDSIKYSIIAGQSMITIATTNEEKCVALNTVLGIL